MIGTQHDGGERDPFPDFRVQAHEIDIILLRVYWPLSIKIKLCDCTWLSLVRPRIKSIFWLFLHKQVYIDFPKQLVFHVLVSSKRRHLCRKLIEF